MESKSLILRGSLYALLGAACWGFSATCASYLMGTYDISVIWLTCIRTCVAGPIFLLLSLATKRDELRAVLHDPKMLLQAAIFALVGVTLMQITYMSAVKYAGAGNALLLEQTGLIVIMLATCLRKHRLPLRREIIALLLAIAGVTAISTQGSINSLGISPLGLLWGLASGAALAGYNLLPTKFLAKYGSIVLNGLAMTLAGIITLPFAKPWETGVSMAIDGWAVLAAVIAFGTIIAYLVYLKGVHEAGPLRASLLALFEPVTAMMLSFIWLGDVITPFDVIGAVLILAMMALTSLPAES